MPQDIQKVAFRVNGKQVNIQNPDPSLLLVDFFRENLYLTGPKKPCGEGGCGGCTSVMAKPKDWNDSSSPEFLSFNSCLRRVVQCEGNEIFTTEYFAQMDNPIFDAKKFHKIQEDIPKTIAYNNGSQCGYCTSGFVSNLAAYCANTCKEKRDIVDIENLFDGNLCRCTGFRPILYGAKTLAHDGNQDEAKNTPVLVTSDLTYFNGGIESKNATVVTSKQKHKKRIHLSLENSQNDITIISEDISTSHSGSPPLLNYKETNKAPQVKRNVEKLEEQIKIISGEVSTWYSGFTTVESLLSYCTKIPQEERNFAAVKFVGANSSHGIYKQKNGYNPKYLFDMSGINSMRQCSMQGGKLKIGGGCSITMLFNELRSIQRKYGDSKNVEVIQKAADNIERVASTIIRNVCSIGGNLAMVVIFGFASDLVNSVYLLESVLTVCHGCKEDFKREQFNIPEFFEFTTQHQGSLFLIESICVDIDKLLTKKPIGVGCYKVAKRLELSHAIVNGGCFFGVKDEKHTAQVAFTIHSPVQPKNFGTEVQIPFREYPKTMAALESLSKEFSVHDLAQVNNLFKEENQELLPSEETLAVTLVNQIFEKFLLQVYYQKIDNTGMVSVEDLVDIFNARRRTSSAGSQRFNVFRQEASEPRVKADALIQAQGKACYTWNKHNLNKNVLHGNFLCSVKGFSPFQVNKEKIEQDFCGIEVYTADMAYKQFGKLGVDAGDDPVRKDLFVQCGDAKPEPMAGSRWIAKDYTQFAGQPVALLLSEDETKLANTIAMIQNHHEEYVTYNGTCKLFRSTDGKELDGTPPITETPVVDMNESIGKKLLLQAAPYNLTKICSADVDYQNPKVNWEKLKEQGCDIRKGAGSTGGQIHMYMEPQSCIAEESDDGGVVLLCSTQCPIIIQSQIAAMLKVPSAKVVIHVNRLGGGFGGKTVQSWTTAAAAVNASFFYHRQIRIALDRNTDMTITGGRHPFFGIYTVAVQRETERIKALQMNFKIQAGYSQDCSMIVGGFALENAFNCYNWGTYFTDVSAYYTNTVSNTAFRGFGVLQSQFLTESVFEHLVDHITVSDHPDRYKTEVSFSRYESELYQRRFTLRQKNFLKNFDMTPHGTIPLIHVNMEKIWSDAKAIYEDWYKEAIRFNEKSLTKKIGVGITPVMYSVSYDIPRMMQGEASLGIKTDGSVILLVGCVEMGQGINTKIMQIVAQTLRIPFSFIHTAELTTNTPPNSQSTGASTGTDLNGSALVKAAEWAVNTIDQFCHNYWLLLNENPLAPEAAGLFRGQKHFQEIFLRLSTDDSGKYQYPSFWIPTDIATNYRTANSYFESSPSQENKEKKAIADSSYFTAKNEREGMWRSLCAQLEFSRCQLLFCGHSNIEGISAINPETGRGDPAMYQTYAAGISQVEVDMLTGEINFRRAKLIVDAGESLNPAIDIGQIEGAFIQGCGYMTSEEVQYDKSGLNAMNSTWEYKPFFAKSIPKEFIVDMFPTEESKMDDEYINAMDYRKQQRKKVRGSESAGVMSSKSTGEPPVVLSISMFQAIRDAIRAHRDYLYRKFSPNKVPLDALIDFNVAPATTSRIQQAIHKINTVYAETSGNPQSFISLLAEQPIVVGNTSFV